mgnify:FL=1
MSVQTTILCRVQAKPERREFVKKILLTLVDQTLTEEGCINFDLHQDNENKNLFICYENWEIKENWIRYYKRAKILDDKTKFNIHALDDYTFNEMTMIE